MEKKEALSYTQQLLKLLDEMNDIYEDVRATKNEHDFMKVVQPYAIKAEELTSIWQQHIQRIIQNRKAYFTGERHVQQVVENTCQLSVQAFYHSTSYSRFKSYLQSTKFLLKTIERQLKEN